MHKANRDSSNQSFPKERGSMTGSAGGFRGISTQARTHAVAYSILDISGRKSIAILKPHVTYFVCEACNRKLLDRLDPFLKYLDDFQVILLKELQVPVPVDSLLLKPHVPYIYTCLPKKSHSKLIVRSMIACFAGFQKYGYSGEVFESPCRFLL